MARKRSGSMMNKFWELMEESVIVQSLVTLAVTITFCTLLALPAILPRMPDGSLVIVDLPKEVWAVIGLIYGYWFGTKKDMAHRRELEVQTTLLDRSISVIQECAIALRTAEVSES